jgi:hypothetical protein
MNFRDLLCKAKAGDEQAFRELLMLYDPLLTKEAIVDRRLDEDLYQELCMVFLHCIQVFPL